MLKNIKKFIEEDRQSFRKAPDGRELFYPWGWPGESFYVSSTQKKKALILSWFLILIFMSLVLFDSFFASLRTFREIEVLTYLLLGLTYILGVFFIKGRSHIYVVPENERPGKKYIMVLACIVVALFLHALPWSSDGWGQLSVLRGSVLVIDLLASVFFLYFIFKLHRTRGYFFVC